MTAKTSAERQRQFREQQKKLGRRQRLKYLTDEENTKVDAYIKRLRKALELADRAVEHVQGDECKG